MTTIRATIELAAACEDVFDALADPQEAVRWLAEYADISLQHGRYEIWGPSVPGSLHRDPERMKLRRAERPAALEFAWRLFGGETGVHVTIDSVDAGCSVTVEHAGLPRGEVWTIASYWATTLENLRAWLVRGLRGPRFDYSDMPAGDIEVGVDIDAPAAAVFDALTDPEMVERWMLTGDARIEPEPGGRYELADWERDGPVLIVDLEPGRKLSYSWRSADLGYETLVTWELEESAGKAHLTLVHSGFAPDYRGDGYRTGWFDFLIRVKYLLEEGAAWSPPTWELIDEEAGAVIATSGD